MQNKTSESPRTEYLKFYKKIIPIFPIIAELIAVSYCMALRLDFDQKIGHFNAGSVWFYILVGGIVAAFILSAILSKMSQGKLTVANSPENNLITLFACSLAAILGIMLLVSSAADISYGRLAKFGQYAAYLMPFISISSVLSLFGQLRSGKIRLVCLSLAAISIIFTMFEMYFDFTVPLNSAVRNLSTITNASVMLFFFAEARATLKSSSRRISTPFYIFANASASCLSLGISVGAILSKLISPMPSDPNMSFLRLSLYTAISLIAVSRLFDLEKISVEFIPAESNEPSAQVQQDDIPTKEGVDEFSDDLDKFEETYSDSREKNDSDNPENNTTNIQ